MRAVRIAAVFLTVMAIGAAAEAAADLPARTVLRQWVVEMKSAARGPFTRIRWFCNDGSILAPKPYACKEHGGGVQHGQWTDRVKRLRAGGYYIANVLASLDPEPDGAASAPEAGVHHPKHAAGRGYGADAGQLLLRGGD